MKTFFQYEIKTVSINGETVENAKVVVSERCGTEKVGNEIEVSEKNQGIPLLNKVYLEETDEFVSVDVEEEPQEPTQLDRIESQLLDIQAYQVEQAYEAAMAAIEGE